MVNVRFNHPFNKKYCKIKDNHLKEQVKKQIKKIIDNPEIGKPMRYGRKGTREVYMSLFRLSYSYLKESNKIIFLELYHKNEQ